MEHLTISQQDLLVHTLDKGFVTYKSQKIYSSRKFYNIISFLRKNNIVNACCVICRKQISDNHHNTCKSRKCYLLRQNNNRMFELTLKGELLAHELRGLKK